MAKKKKQNKNKATKARAGTAFSPIATQGQGLSILDLVKNLETFWTELKQGNDSHTRGVTQCFEQSVVQHNFDPEALLEVVDIFAALERGKESLSEQSLERLIQLAEHGDVIAQTLVGLAYSRILSEAKRNHELAVHYFSMAAERGVPLSQYYLAKLYLNNAMGDEDEDKAINWFEKAAENGYLSAYWHLGYLYCLSSQTRAADFEKAFPWIYKAAQQQYLSAQLLLAGMYRDGLGVNKNIKQAVFWYKKAAEKKNIQACYHLAMIYFDGLGGKKDLQKGAFWYEQARKGNEERDYVNLGIDTDHELIAYDMLYEKAEAGDDIIQTVLGRRFLCGTGADLDKEQAVFWLTKAAEAGNEEAAYLLGQLYFKEELSDLHNEEKAYRWYTKAATEDYGPAQVMIAYGLGVNGQHAEARFWLRRALQEDCEEAVDLLLCKDHADHGMSAINLYYDVLVKAADADVSDALYRYGKLLCAGEFFEQDVQTGLKYLQRAADKRNADALLLLGSFYQHGQIVPQDTDKSKSYFEAASREGLLQAHYELAMLDTHLTEIFDFIRVERLLEIVASEGYVPAQIALAECLLGVKGPMSLVNMNWENFNRQYTPLTRIEQGLYWLSQAANQGSRKALCMLGHLYRVGLEGFIDKDRALAFKFLQRFEVKDYSQAWYELALLYASDPEVNEDIPRDNAKAISFMLKAAEAGVVEAENELASWYELGLGVEQDIEKALMWYNKAAQQNFIEAIFNLGMLYKDGREGLAKDSKRAYEYFQKGADAKHVPSLEQLGFFYYAAEDFSNAFCQFRLAASYGSTRAAYMLASMYEAGEGTPQNIDQAIEFYEIAACQGLVQAQYHLAVLYMDGEGVERNMSKAVKWFRKAANQGDEISQYNLGYCYANGESLHQDYTKAAQWYRKAAKQGFALAQYSLGLLYLDGQGVVQNDKTAAQWIELAAEQELPEAQHTLGLLYYEGIGLSKDPQKAIALWKKAASQGIEDALEKLNEVGEALPTEQ